MFGHFNGSALSRSSNDDNPMPRILQIQGYKKWEPIHRDLENISYWDQRARIALRGCSPLLAPVPRNESNWTQCDLLLSRHTQACAANIFIWNMWRGGCGSMDSHSFLDGWCKTMRAIQRLSRRGKLSGRAPEDCGMHPKRSKDCGMCKTTESPVLWRKITLVSP